MDASLIHLAKVYSVLRKDVSLAGHRRTQISFVKLLFRISGLYDIVLILEVLVQLVVVQHGGGSGSPETYGIREAY